MTPPTVGEVLRRARRVRPIDLWTGLVTAALAPLVELGLRTIGVRRTAELLDVRLRLDGAPDEAERTRRVPLSRGERRKLRIAWWLVAVLPFDGSCLRRSLIGARLLRKRSHAVRIGVRKEAGEFKAHAWLEIDGASLDPAAADFAATWSRVGATP